jgi:hypothetical protein
MTYTNLEVSELAFSRPLVRSMGTFFNHLSSDREYYSRFCQAIVEAYTEVWKTLAASKAQASPDTADLIYNDRYKLLRLKASDSRSGTDGKFRFPMPTDIEAVNFLTDKIERPTIFWAQGVDFGIENWGDKPWLVLNYDPFSTAGVEITSTLNESNEVSDRFVSLWMVAPTRKIYPLTEQWGAVFDVAPITEDQRSHLLQLFKTMALGPTFIRLMIGAGRAFGHPVCEVDQEVVTSVISDCRGTAVITDKSVYRFPAAALITTDIGDVLRLGQTISSAILWYDLSSGFAPELAGLAISKTELGSAYMGGLIFPNEERDVLVTSQADKTKIQVPLDGSVEDQQTFWDEVHTRGVAGGNTLANFLDTRPNPIGEPEASNLPATLNPYKLLVSQSLCYHTTLCVLDYSQSLSNEGAQFLANWRRLMPSHQDIHAYSMMVSVTGGRLSTFSNFDSPSMGLVMLGSTGYYGIGTFSSAGGEPVIDQGAF